MKIFFLNQLFSSLVSFKGIQAFLTGRFLIKVEQTEECNDELMNTSKNIHMRINQGFVCYVAPDCKASMARIGVASLRQFARGKQHERFYRCFAARCRRILQGHFSQRSNPKCLLAKAPGFTEMPPRRSCGLQVDVLPLQQEIQVASLFAFCPFFALMSSLRSVFVTFLREKSKRIKKTPKEDV